MSHLQVAVLRGGPSEENAVSMRTGAAVLRALAEAGYQTKDVVITQEGDWLDHGLVRQPDNILKAVDVVFIALHGEYGEDGEVQRMLQRLHIPFTGSRSFPSAQAFNKTLTKRTLAAHDILTPAYQEVIKDEYTNPSQIASAINSAFGPEYIVKPVASGSSFGVEIVRPGQDLSAVIERALEQYDRILIEEYIRGREATVATLENFRSTDIYVFPAIEIVTPREAKFFDTEFKYNGCTSEICPSNFPYKAKSELAEVAAAAHEILDLSQYSRSDFIVSESGIYFLEVNTLPGLTSESLYPKAAAAVGLDLKNLVTHLVETATV
jgi:D-alanine-D-alanine ligase